MRDRQRALLIVGSPRRGKSTSAALGNYLLAGLAGQGFATETLFAVQAQRSEESLAALCAAVDGADPVILAFPLYADSIPAPLVSVMEALAIHRKGRGAEGKQRLAAIVNSGFPEAAQSAVALRICRRFAREAFFSWAGGLALGGGESVGGKPLAEAGGAARHARRALDLAAAPLAEGGKIPDEAVAAMARPFVWSWLYTLIGSFGWKRDAKKHGVGDRIRARPYRQE
jgi:hypothetical protein